MSVVYSVLTVESCLVMLDAVHVIVLALVQ